jgi:hypothetical protein
MKEIEPLCFNCLRTKLTDSYKQFGARALVIQPTAGFPCYVFQPLSKWNRYKLGEEPQELLSKMENSCQHGKADANFLWLTSNGLVENNGEKLVINGISETLFRWANGIPRRSAARAVWTSFAKASRVTA